MRKNNVDDMFLRDKDAAARIGISRSYFRKLVKENKLPQPFRLANKVIVWRNSDLQGVINSAEKLFPRVGV